MATNWLCYSSLGCVVEDNGLNLIVETTVNVQITELLLINWIDQVACVSTRNDQ